MARTISAKNGARTIVDRREHVARGVRERLVGIVVPANDQLFGVRAQRRARSARVASGARGACARRSRGSSAGMRREASPHHVARVAEPVEKLGLVAGDARGKNLRLPRDGGNFVAFELADYLQRAVDSVQPRRSARRAASAAGNATYCAAVTGSISRRKRPIVKPMDAREHAPVAPFLVAVVDRRNRPRSTWPCVSRRSSAAAIAALSSASVPPICATVIGPLDSSHPRDESRVDGLGARRLSGRPRRRRRRARARAARRRSKSAVARVRRTPLRDELLEPGLPRGDRRHDDQRGERVV